MVSGLNFWDDNVWSFIITLTILFAGMMLANTLRNTIRFLRKLMIPSSVLGGFIVLFVDYIYRQIAGHSMFETSVLEMLTYHGLGLGFVAMALRTIEKQTDKRIKTGGFDSGVTVVAGYLIQALVGLVITLVCYKLLDSFWASGMLLPMGYGQGPGQAYNWGRTYENTYGFTDGTSFGLTVAAMGFIAASIGGIIYLNVLRRKGVIEQRSDGIVIDKQLSAQHITGEGEIPVTEAMDKFTVQVALVFFAYALAYLFMMGVEAIIETGVMGNFGYNTVRPLIWGFNFLFGTIFAMLLKGVLRGLKKRGVIKREYANNFMQNRISGVMFDLMVVASIAAIDLSAFRKSEFLIPLTLICVIGAFVSYFYLRFICHRVFTKYEHEAFLSLYGMQTGTASTGVILLREIDPHFETQAATNLVTHKPWAIVFGFPMLLLMGVAPQSVSKALIAVGVFAVLFIAMNIILLRHYIFKKRTKKQAEKG